MSFLPAFLRCAVAVSAFTLVACSGSDEGTPEETTDSATATDTLVTDEGVDTALADSATADSTSTDSTSSDSASGDTASGDSTTADSTSGDSMADADTATPDGSAKPCTATGGECGATEYCDTPSCTTGTCKPRPSGPSVAYDPACGCDGVTYWNAAQAASRGASAHGGKGACSGAGTKTCGGFVGTPCPTDTRCVMDLSSFSTCSVADAGGQCWFVPTGATCPGVIITNYRDCTTSVCGGICDGVKSGHPFRKDNTCPM